MDTNTAKILGIAYNDATIPDKTRMVAQWCRDALGMATLKDDSIILNDDAGLGDIISAHYGEYEERWGVHDQGGYEDYSGPEIEAPIETVIAWIEKMRIEMNKGVSLVGY